MTPIHSFFYGDRMPSITRRLEFDYGHRVLGHEGKCKHLHGHRGIIEITVSAESLDNIGRVVDFGKIKEIVGGWIDENWDHNMILCGADPLLQLSKNNLDVIFASKRPYVLPGNRGNPTAENLAAELFRIAFIQLDTIGIKVEKVRFFETPNSWADYPS